MDAAALLAHLKYLENDNKRRKEIAERYRQKLEGFKGIRFTNQTYGGESSFHFLPMFIDRRDALLDSLKEEGISCGVHYNGNHNYSIFKNQQQLSNTDWWSTHEITLPIHLQLTDEDVEKVIEAVKRRR